MARHHGRLQGDHRSAPGRNTYPHHRRTPCRTLQRARKALDAAHQKASHGHGKAARWKSQKANFPTSLANPAHNAGFALSHRLCDDWLTDETGHFICYEKRTFLLANDNSEPSLRRNGLINPKCSERQRMRPPTKRGSRCGTKPQTHIYETKFYRVSLNPGRSGRSLGSTVQASEDGLAWGVGAEPDGGSVPLQVDRYQSTVTRYRTTPCDGTIASMAPPVFFISPVHRLSRE